MKTLGLMTAVDVVLASAMGGVAADPWKDESRHGRWNGGYDHRRTYQPQVYYHERDRQKFKQEFRRGGCKVERKWDDGKYKEEVECERAHRPPAYGYFYFYRD